MHITPANLISQFHRSIEPPTTARVLKRIFADAALFAHHDPLPAAVAFADEGAANHMRLSAADAGEMGLEIFVAGRGADHGGTKFPARQSRLASNHVARMHQLRSMHVVMATQTQAAIDAGAFHNDVVAVASGNTLLAHEKAFRLGVDGAELRVLADRYADACGRPLRTIIVTDDQVPLADAVSSYLFNSQLVTLPDGRLALVAPIECRANERVAAFLSQSPFDAVYFVDVRQSMSNGGGPACLRLRVELTERELAATHAGVLLTPALYDELTAWVTKHYRDQLTFEDLADPSLLDEGRRALDELTRILDLGSLYEFQR